MSIDALTLLHIVLKWQVVKATWAKLLEMDDDMVAVALAALCPRSKHAVVNRVKGWGYLCDADYEQHWLVRYELRRVGLLGHADLSASEKEWMEILLSTYGSDAVVDSPSSSFTRGNSSSTMVRGGELVDEWS